MSYDVVIVGAGVSGLSAAIRLKQLATEKDKEIGVLVVEKGSEVGAHVLSGAVMDPVALTELLPNWKEDGAPVTCEVTEDRILYLTKNRSFRSPVIPPSFDNHGNYIISLGLLVRWLGEQAENLGVEIYPGFAAADVLYDDEGSVKGVLTGDMGLDKDGNPTDMFQPGMELLARQTVFAEGCRGSLSRKLIAKFKLDEDSEPQTYGIGIKEIWQVKPEKHVKGLVMHTIGWPLDNHTYGGSFMYHLDDDKVACGFVVGLDYENPWLSPFEEFQRYKTHPSVRTFLEGGKRIAYGARALVEGGLQSLPKLSFKGGVLVGDAAGFLNVPRIKGIHTAIKSGMIAAEAVFEKLMETEETPEAIVEADTYRGKFEESWLYRELRSVRNVRPSFKWGNIIAYLYTGFEQIVLRNKSPWTISHERPDNEALRKAADCPKIEYPKPDNQLSFDRLSSVFLAAVSHNEEQPCHIKLRNPDEMLSINHDLYASPETRYCPAGVYEIVEEEGSPKLRINFTNCVHCKTCDIKDVAQNIVWSTPEGGGGPNYSEM